MALAPEKVQTSPAGWASQVLARNVRAAGRAISLIENSDAAAEELIRTLYPHTGNAYTVGVTGPPGAGKSTLVDNLVQVIRIQQKRVGIIAVDPNSPFSGGAILGDRIRMMRHTVDPGVFIRSMGSRGHLGGVALATSHARDVLDAFGMDIVFLETVGVGQSELEVAEIADTTVVVLTPGQGDSVQSIKAGIMEIADIFAVNKADHPATARAVADLNELLRLDSQPREWTPTIIQTIATSEEGTAELWQAIGEHRAFLEDSGALSTRRRSRLERQILEIATRRVRDEMLLPTSDTPGFQEVLQAVSERRVDPFAAARQLQGRIKID